MNRALLLVAGWVGQGMATWLSAFKRPLGELSVERTVAVGNDSVITLPPQ